MTVSDWAAEKFGEHAAAAAVAIAGGLHAGHRRAIGSHEAGGLATADGYGSVLWLAVAEEIGHRLAEIDGSRRIRPNRARYSLGVVNHNIVFPQRIASDLRTGANEARLPMSQVKADLFSLAPAPAPKPETLPLWDDEELVVDQDEVTLDGVADMGEAGLVVVAYVSSADGGLLRAWWGEASLVPDGRLARLEWRHREQLDLTQVEPLSARPTLTVVSNNQTPEPAPRRFDSGELEETPLGVRTPLTSVTSEPELPVTPAANSDDES